MKLIDLLVKELPKRGGWPDGAVECCRHYGENSIDFYDETGNWDDDCYLKYGKDFAKDCIYEESSGSHRLQSISRQEYESALAASEGWIEWHGGECPVHGTVYVDVKLRSGHVTTERRAYSLDWNHYTPDGEGAIIAYRLHKPDINSRSNDDRLEQDLNECIGQDVDIPEWNGEGFPPIGVECEVKIGGGNYNLCRVVYSDANAGVAFIYLGGDDEKYCGTIDCVSSGAASEYFRPLRTEAEMAREKLAASLHIAAGASPIELNGIGPLYFKLADAIISGSVFGTTFKAGK